MLIEDMGVKVEITPTEHSSNQETPEVDVKSLNINFGINTLSEAVIDVTQEKRDKPYYLNSSTYTRELFVGKSIKVTWVPGFSKNTESSNTNKEVPLFEGVITGIRINKNPNSVSYGLQIGRAHV